MTSVIASFSVTNTAATGLPGLATCENGFLNASIFQLAPFVSNNSDNQLLNLQTGEIDIPQAPGVLRLNLSLSFNLDLPPNTNLGLVEVAFQITDNIAGVGETIRMILTSGNQPGWNINDFISIVNPSPGFTYSISIFADFTACTPLVNNILPVTNLQFSGELTSSPV